jgi:tripartite-type tricarboxylate transporter receptor subunit TctC
MAPDVVKKLHDAVIPMLSKPEIKEKLAGQGMNIWPRNGHQVAAALAAERARFAELVKASGFVAQDA